MRTIEEHAPESRTGTKSVMERRVVLAALFNVQWH
jgi:hypothetical protein